MGLRVELRVADGAENETLEEGSHRCVGNDCAVEVISHVALVDLVVEQVLGDEEAN